MSRGAPAMRYLLLVLPALAVSQESAPEIPVCKAAEQATYEYRLEQAVVAGWEIPRRAKGVRCTVIIVQNFRGEVLDARVEDCGDDVLVQKSVVDAAYRASPLPLPGNDACFERQVRLQLVQRSEPAR
jgi:hypothetical protein